MSEADSIPDTEPVGAVVEVLLDLGLQRIQAGLPPITTGQVLGVAGAPPGLTSGMIYIGLGVLAFAMLRK